MARLLIVVSFALLLAGCISPGGVLDPLPDPAVRTWPPRPQTAVAKPRPAPAPTPRPRPQPRRSLGKATVVVDAGHGGKDPGTQPRGSRVPEKTIVLDIANRLANRLAQRGANVVRTRTSDRFIELEDRAAAADRHSATLFVSIHVDALPRKPSASGAVIYVARGALPASRRAARRIQSALTAAGLHCRGIREAKFIVLVRHSRPAVLIECGYLTNKNDARRLNSPSQRAKIAAAIANGIADYCTR